MGSIEDGDLASLFSLFEKSLNTRYDKLGLLLAIHCLNHVRDLARGLEGPELFVEPLSGPVLDNGIR